MLEDTVNVAVEVPEPGEAIEVGLKLTVTPVGAPDEVSATAELNPPPIVEVMVEVPELPTTTDTEVGDAERLKVGVWVVEPARALIRPVPLGLPHPVTRSKPVVAE